MNRKEKWITAAILAVLFGAACISIPYVLWKQQPAQMEAFRTRFRSVESLNWQTKGTTEADLSATDQRLELTWPQSETGFAVESDIQPLDAEGELLVSAQVSGMHNASARDRWGFQAWMELRVLKGDQLIRQKRIELPLESELNRDRIYAIEADTAGGDGWQLCLSIEPLDGTVTPGHLQLFYLEVRTK